MLMDEETREFLESRIGHWVQIALPDLIAIDSLGKLEEIRGEFCLIRGQNGVDGWAHYSFLVFRD